MKSVYVLRRTNDSSEQPEF